MLQNHPNHPGPGHQQGLPSLQHPRSAGLMQHQQHHPNSPRHQSQAFQPPTANPYVSPHSSTHSLAQHHQSPYVASVHGLPAQPPSEPSFFGAHPSPYSTNSTAGSYTSSEPPENMTTQAATISRQPYPPISSYQTPQSNSPASIQSPPGTDGRLYGIPSMPQQMYYNPNQYQMQQQHSGYGQHPSAAQHNPSMTPAPGMLMSHPQPQQQLQHPQPHHAPTPSGMLDQKPSSSSLQHSPSGLVPPQSTSQQSSGPAPGPIPATTPLVVRQDNNGVQWIAFEYSRDRVKMEYTIRCDVESVNVDELSAEFKSANCVYPRACVGKDQYKGNRLHYESECNAVGWALAELNPNLREKRGLIQRAVDSWRNSNQDVRLRSRRVRRMAKIQNRTTAKTGTQFPGSGGGGIPSQGMPPGAGRPPTLGSGGPPLHHHHTEGSESGGGNDVAGNEYSAGHHNHATDHHGGLTSPATARYAHNFYTSYPPQPSAGRSSIPLVHDAIDPMHSRASTLATSASTAATSKRDEEEHKRALFGDLPESKRRKFVLVDDNQRGTRVRVRVMLDQVNMDDMPDAHLRINAVYPRSFFSRQMRSPSAEPGAGGRWDDVDDEADGPSSEPAKTLVPVSLMDGSEAQLPVPRMTTSRRNKEVAINELGYRMSWAQARTFNGRKMFLQRSLDAYRNKTRSSLIASSDEVTIAPHFETRPGKRKWLERKRRVRSDAA